MHIYIERERKRDSQMLPRPHRKQYAFLCHRTLWVAHATCCLQSLRSTRRRLSRSQISFIEMLSVNTIIYTRKFLGRDSYKEVSCITPNVLDIVAFMKRNLCTQEAQLNPNCSLKHENVQTSQGENILLPLYPTNYVYIMYKYVSIYIYIRLNLLLMSNKKAHCPLQEAQICSEGFRPLGWPATREVQSDRSQILGSS